MTTKMLQLELESFQGPFDLLLHLIKQMEVDINDIPMTEITEQYLAYIESMQELELDTVGDYLVMASTLIEIKSRLLLPVEPDPEVDSDYEDGDPREALVQQLLLYQQFQTVATQLELKQQSRAQLFTRPMTDVSAYQTFVPLDEDAINIQELSEAMQLALEKFADRQPLEREVHHDTMTVSEQIEKIYAYFDTLPQGEGVLFQTLIQTGSRPEIITTFMAMLELVKGQKLVFKQENRDADIKLLKLEGLE